MRILDGPDSVLAAVGEEFGTSAWHAIDQGAIDTFAALTGDHQWIHVDPARAAAESPYGATVAHGYFTLSLVPRFLAEVMRLEGRRASFNYGLERVRFPAPVRVDSRLRGRVRLLAAQPHGERGVRTTFGVTIELEGGDRPACVAEPIGVHVW